MEDMTFIWLIICIAAAGLELATFAMVSIWFCIGALFAMVLAFLGATETVQIAVFVIVSLISLAVFRIKGQKETDRLSTPTNADRVIGREGLVLKPIDDVKEEGLISVDGMEWSARSSDGRERIDAGETVVVERIEGAKLIVRLKNKDMTERGQKART